MGGAGQEQAEDDDGKAFHGIHAFEWWRMALPAAFGT